MANRVPLVSQAFVEQQRLRLEALLAQMLNTELAKDSIDRTFRSEHGGEAEEFEEKAQDTATVEVDRTLHAVDERRIRAIERALQKIAEGTYGHSDVSGKPIPMARLETTPEAVLTVQEEAEREKQQRP